MVSIFFFPHICWIKTFLTFLHFWFSRFLILVLYRLSFFNIFVELCPENRIFNVPKWKILKIKKIYKCYCSTCVRAPQKNWHHFGLFLSLFLAFHLKFLQLCKKPPSYISGTHQLLFPLVNNSQNWCQKLCKKFSPLFILQGECDYDFTSDIVIFQ